MARRDYIRLSFARPRSWIAVISGPFSSLWVAKDHLLCIESSGYKETYKRFYFRDIQAFLVQKNQIRNIRCSILGGITVASGLVDAVFSRAAVGFIIFEGAIILIGLIVLYDLLAGQSASCVLLTRVQTELLPSLNRLRRARKVLNRLRPLIAAAQGSMTAEGVSLRVHAGGAPIQSAPNRAPTAETPDVPPVIGS